MLRCREGIHFVRNLFQDQLRSSVLPLSLDPGCVKHLPWCAAMWYLCFWLLYWAAGLTLHHSVQKPDSLLQHLQFSAAPVQELCSRSVSATGLLCFTQTVCCTPWLAVLRENLSHNGVVLHQQKWWRPCLQVTLCLRVQGYFSF